MDKLIPLIDYVLEQDLPQPIRRAAGQMVKYGLFLKQKLELWMFVPCKFVDGVWIVLEEPENYDCKKKCPFKNDFKTCCKSAEFNKAKSKVLFEDVEYIPTKLPSHASIVRICKDFNSINYPRFWRDVTVESLISYNLPLTESAKKIINI